MTRKTQAEQMKPATSNGATTEAVPTMDTLQDWHVGRMSDGLNEVRFVLTSQ